MTVLARVKGAPLCMKKITSMTKQNTVSYIIAGMLILAASIALWYFPKEYAYRQQPSRDNNLNPVNGVWDLTAFDLDTQIIFIEGDVEYVPGALLTPDAFDAYEGTIEYGPTPDDRTAGTARLRLVFPEDKVYSLVSRAAEYSERVYVNGLWRHDVGIPGLTARDSVAMTGYKRIDVIPENGIVEIVRQSANFVHKEAGGFAGYYISSPDNIAQMMALSQMFMSINIGLYLCLFLLHMILYLLVRGYRPNLWFALLCLVWLLRAGMTGRFVFWTMFPNIPWELGYKLGCVSIAVTGILLILMARDQFPGTVQKWPLRLFVSAQSALAVCFLIADTVTDSHIKVAAEVLLYIAAAYLALRFVMVLPRQIRRRELLPEQAVTLAGLAVALFAMLHDAMRYNNWMKGIFYYEIGEVGMLALVLLQMVAMIIGVMRQLNTARQSAALAFETAEVARKNEALALLRAHSAEQDLELHRQIIAAVPLESLVTYGTLILNTEKNQAFLKDIDLQLRPKEFTLLLHLIRYDGKPVSREALYQAVWDQPFVSTDRAFDSALHRLRGKIEAHGHLIRNARGQGYWLELEVNTPENL